MTLPQSASALFAIPSAEREPWLADVFVWASGFEQVVDNESAVIYAAPGAGKTALRLWAQRSAPADVLVVTWLPEPVTDVEPSTPLAQTALRQAIQALVERVAQDEQISARLQQTPAWVGMALAWFLRTYLPLEAAFYMRSQASGLSAETVAWYLALLENDPVQIFKPDSTQNDQLRILMSILQLAGFQHVWWMVDGLEKWHSQADRAVRALIESLLSTLAIFDLPRFVFKVFAPESLQEVFEKTSGIARDRLKLIKFTWSEANLTKLVEARLEMGLSQPGFRLARLCPDPDFYNWLCKYGGSNPRAWISLMRPFIERFEMANAPLSPQDWQRIAHESPPPLRLFPERQEARLGEYSISIDSSDGFKILQYVHRHAGQLCSLEEVYFCGLKGMEKPPGLRDTGWEHKSLWRPALDTSLYRLRKRLEWDSSNPVYLVTQPRRGLELRYVADLPSVRHL